MKCFNPVGGNCPCCRNTPIKYGKSQNKQRYHCKNCKKTWLAGYTKQAFLHSVNSEIAAHVKEGCGIRSIARLLHISATTVISRIQKIANDIKKPAIMMERTYEVDELKTYIKSKSNEYWVIYAMDKDSRVVVDLKVGKRNKKNIKRVTDTLLLADCKLIYTDKLDIYGFVIPKMLHRTRRYGTNHIERKNLTLRTHLKRLNRKTIAFSKSLLMLEACLKIYFWYT
jgi:insertion element IS1 protein InsB